MLRLRIGLTISIMLLASPAIADALQRYVAPTAQGTRDGLSPANASSYLSTYLWNDVKSKLNTQDVTVNFVPGTYNTAGGLTLSDLGNAQHHLTLQGSTPTGAVLSADTPQMLGLYGVQNATVRYLNFTGPIQQYALGIGSLSHDIVVEDNSWANFLPQYGAMGIVHGAYNITVRNNTFQNVGSDSHAHMIYASYDAHDILVEGNTFQNSVGDYVRFRDNLDNVVVRNNTFRSTGSTYNSHPFVSVPLFNDVNPGDEFFATNYQIYGNSFSFYTGSSGSYAISFANYGYDYPGYHYLMTTAEGNILVNGTAAQKYQLLLTNTGIDTHKIYVLDNTYSHIASEVVFGSFADYGAVSKGWEGFADISGIVNRVLPTPEPSSFMLMFVGVAAYLLARGRKAVTTK